MLKGFALGVPFTLMTVVFLIIITSSFGLFIIGQMINYGEVARSSIEDMNSIDAAHLIEHCFSNGMGVIEWSFLMSEENKDLCDIESCRLCSIDVGAKIVDIEKTGGKNTWIFGFDSGEGTDHEIFVNIRDGWDVHVGRLHVQI